MNQSDFPTELHLHPRLSTAVTLNIPTDTYAALQEVAANRDTTVEALMKLYIGQGLRHDVAPIVPIIVPDLDAVRQFAVRLHVAGQPWHGEAFGWDAEYSPERPTPPLDSKMTFTPADFCIGESGIWFFSLMWEHGRDQPPVEFLDERNLLGPAE